MPIIGGNRWNDWVREFAKKNNTTYGCAISMPDCKEGYRKAYPKPVKGKRGRPKKTAVVDDDFGLAPDNITMSIEELPPPNPKELEAMAGEDKNVSKDRIDDLMDMWDKILDNNDKTPIKTQGAYVKRLQKPICRPLVQYHDGDRMSKPQKKRYNALWKRSNAMYENLPKAKDLKKKREEAKNTPYDPLEEAKPTTEPVSKGISIKKKATPAPAPVIVRPKSSEVASLARQAKSSLFGEGATPEGAKKFARPLVVKLAGYYNANLLNKIDDKLVQAIVKKYNEITKESVMLGHGRINRIRLKRMRGGKEKQSYAPEKIEMIDQREPMPPEMEEGDPPPPAPVEVVAPIAPPPLPVGNQRLRRRIVDGEVREERGRGRPKKGGDLIGDLTNKVQQFRKGAKDVAIQSVSAITPTPLKEAVNAVAEKFVGDDLPNNVKATLKKYGDQPITGLTIGRTPVPKYIGEALNVVSLGEWKKKFASKPYDTLYHLFLIIRTSGGQFLIEKNERINTSTTIPKNAETSVVSGNFGGLTPNIILEKTKALMGDQFLSYSAFNNNCQHFISSILKSNQLGSPADYAFVKQDTESLFENSPQTRKFADTLTDLGARVSKITGRGRGRPRKGGVTQKVAEILNPNFENHPALYQNPLLQHVGAVTQKGIPWGIGANAGGYETDSSTSSDSDMEGGTRNPELRHQLSNYNDILGHLSSHLLSNEKQDPRDLQGALRYARELVRVLEKWSMTGQGKPSKVYTETDEGQPSSCLPCFKNTVYTDSNFSSVAPDPSGLRTGDIQHPNRVPRDEDAINRLADANRKFRNRVAPRKTE
jgi:hypothetical protein